MINYYVSIIVSKIIQYDLSSLCECVPRYGLHLCISWVFLTINGFHVHSWKSPRTKTTVCLICTNCMFCHSNAYNVPPRLFCCHFSLISFALYSSRFTSPAFGCITLVHYIYKPQLACIYIIIVTLRWKAEPKQDELYWMLWILVAIF